MKRLFLSIFLIITAVSGAAPFTALERQYIYNVAKSVAAGDIDVTGIGQIKWRSDTALGYMGVTSDAGLLRTGTSIDWSWNQSGNYITLDAIQGIRTVDTPEFAGLGIGESTPDTLVHIKGAHTSNKGMLYLEGTTHAMVSLESASGSNSAFLFRENAANIWQVGHESSSGDMFFQSRVGGDNTRIRLHQTGDVNVVTGDIYVSDGNSIGTDGAGWTFNGPSSYIWTNGPYVGIGTDTPNNSLQVAGLVNFDDTAFSVALGTDALKDNIGARTIAIGYQAGENNSIAGGGERGTNNVYIGYLAGKGAAAGNTGFRNINIGRSAGASNSSGNQNTIIGYQAGLYTSSGYNNFFLGSFSGQANTTGFRNCFLGAGSGLANKGGSKNVFLGESAGLRTQDGVENTIIGTFAGGQGAGTGTSFNRNTILGNESGNLLSTGNDNLFLGYKAGFRQTTNSNLLIIDNQDRSSAANEANYSLIYGTFAADPNSQSLVINGDVNIDKTLTVDENIIISDAGYIGSASDTDLIKLESDSIEMGTPDSNYVDIDGATGQLTLAGDARVWKYWDVTPDAVKLPGSNPPASDNIDSFAFLRFDRGTEESVHYIWHVPTDFAVGSGSVKGHFEFIVENPPSGGGDEAVVMGFEYKKLEENDVFSFTSGTSSGTVTETITDGETAIIVHETPEGTCTTTGWDVGDTILFRFYRDATNVNDTYDNEAVGADNDVWVYEFHMKYLADKLGEAS